MRLMAGLSLLAAIMLQACASTGAVTQNLGALVNSTGSFSYDPATDTITATFTYNNANIASFPAGISSYRYTLPSASTSEYLVRGVTPSGQGIVMIHETASGLQTYLERTAPSALPLSGTATFTGDYGAAYSRTTSSGISWGHMTGNAQVDVNLDTSFVSGTISNRQNTGGLLASDIIFSGGLANGEFTAGLGGSGAFISDTPSYGFPASSAQGMLVGPDGNELIVAIRFAYRSSTSPTNLVTHVENGVITATKN